QLADDGKSIICITHNVENVDRCHLVLVLAGGKLMYYGPPEEAPTYFGVGRLGQIYDRLSEGGPEPWEKEFKASSLYREFVEQRMAEEDQYEAEGQGQPAAISVDAAGDDSVDVTGATAIEPTAPPRPQEDEPTVGRTPGRKLRRLTARFRRARRVLTPIQI